MVPLKVLTVSLTKKLEADLGCLDPAVRKSCLSRYTAGSDPEAFRRQPPSGRASPPERKLEAHYDADGEGVMVGQSCEDGPVLRHSLHPVPMLEMSAPTAQMP